MTREHFLSEEHIPYYDTFTQAMCTTSSMFVSNMTFTIHLRVVEQIAPKDRDTTAQKSEVIYRRGMPGWKVILIM